MPAFFNLLKLLYISFLCVATYLGESVREQTQGTVQTTDTDRDNKEFGPGVRIQKV